MIPPNYVPSDPSRESERTKAALAVVAEYCDGKDKISRHPFEREYFCGYDARGRARYVKGVETYKDVPLGRETVYVEELNALLRARGFDDYTVEHDGGGHLVLLSRPDLPGPPGPSLPVGFALLTLEEVARVQERMRNGGITMAEANRMVGEMLDRARGREPSR